MAKRLICSLTAECLEVECSHLQINLSFTYFIISAHFPLSNHPEPFSFLPVCLREFLLLYLPPVPGDILLWQEGCRLYSKKDFQLVVH